jgi:hypothetical protein
MKMTTIVPLPLTWKIYHINIDSLGYVVSTYILNQSKGYWL